MCLFFMTGVVIRIIEDIHDPWMAKFHPKWSWDLWLIAFIFAALAFVSLRMRRISLRKKPQVFHWTIVIINCVICVIIMLTLLMLIMIVRDRLRPDEQINTNIPSIILPVPFIKTSKDYHILPITLKSTHSGDISAPFMTNEHPKPFLILS